MSLPGSNMVDLFGSSPATTNTLNWCNFRPQSYISCGHVHRIGCRYIHSYTYLGSDMKTNSKFARIYALNIEEGHIWFRAKISGMPPMGLLFGSIITGKWHIVRCKFASVESDSIYGEERTLCQKEEDDTAVNSFEQKLPPWGSLESQQDSVSQTDGVNLPLKVSKGLGTLNDYRIYYLEERNEELLSKRILGLSRSNKVRSALELYRSMEFSGLQPNLHACNSLLSSLLRNNLLDDASRIFESMKASEMTSSHTYSLILKAVANARGCDAALDMFEELEESGSLEKDFDAIFYNTMISVCGKANNWVRAEQIWRHLLARGYTGTTVTYRLLVCLFVRCGQNELAFEAYHEMIENGLKPAEDAMQAIIGASTKEGRWDLALSVFQIMLESGLKPNLIACNALINSLGKARKVQLAVEVYGIMKSLGYAPDAYTWNALLGALYRANQHGDALRLFEHIQKGQSYALNMHVYNTALMSCQKLGLWDRALQLLWQMEASGLSVSTASYNLVIGACEIARRPKIALQVYEHMVHQKHSPDTFTLLSLIRGCIWGSLWDKVEEILGQVAPNGSLYNAAVQGMCLRGNVYSAKKLYEKMQQIGLKPDDKTRALMLQNLRKVSIREGRR